MLETNTIVPPKSLTACLRFLEKMIEKGGPDQYDYPFFNQILENLSEGITQKKILDKDLDHIYALFDADFLQNTLHGHSYRKPYGYAGDFMVIDKVYQKEFHPNYKKWDEFILNHRTCIGIRNRKEYFKQLMVNICKESKQNRIDLLNVASGPARDVQELYRNKEVAKKLFTHCVEYDPSAIDYAQKLTGAFKHQITFENGNIYAYQTEKKYDVIWSSGLFDYFNDKVFVSILKKFMAWSKPKAKIVLGNVTPAHSLKGYMEILMKWPLHIRTAKDLIRLATEAGVKSDAIKIGVEEAGVFLFLHIEMP